MISAQTFAEAQLLSQLADFAPISLTAMEAVALLDRTDTKYLISERQLIEILAALKRDYWVLEVAGARLCGYQNLYFDTSAFALYRSHHAGQGQRYKVRCRRYVDTTHTYLEIKRKTNQGRTIKRRTAAPELISQLTPELNQWLFAEGTWIEQALEPKLRNDFARITLVSQQRSERLTLDVNLQFGDLTRWVSLPGIVIAEVKRANPHTPSDFAQQMQALHVRPLAFSKYCVGVALLYQQLKHNNFKPTLRLIEKLAGGSDGVHRTC